jgi:hypothetical protein
MSLINDALKKAQKLQTQQPPASASPAGPAAGAPSAPVVIRRGKPVGFETMLLGLVAAVVVIVGITVIAVLIFRKEGKPVVAAASHATSPVAAAPAAPVPAAPAAATTPAAASTTPPAPVASTAASTPAAAQNPPPSQPPVSEPPVQTAVSPPPAPVAVPIATTPATESPAPSVSVQVNTAAPAPAVIEAPPASVAKPSPPAAPQQNRKILVYIDGLRVTGVRSAGTDSKVLMNDRVYRVNDMVDYELGLRLTGVTTAVLTFVDENSVVYTKTF